MNKRDDEHVHKWIAGWQNAAPILDKLRIEAIRNSNTASSIEQLSDAFESALRHYKPSNTSGLVEQQRLFARCRR